jgi:hypothetical protein
VCVCVDGQQHALTSHGWKPRCASVATTLAPSPAADHSPIHRRPSPKRRPNVPPMRNTGVKRPTGRGSVTEMTVMKSFMGKYSHTCRERMSSTEDVWNIKLVMLRWSPEEATPYLRAKQRTRKERVGWGRPCATERVRNRARAQPSACATEPAAGGVRGVSPRQPPILPASAAEEHLLRTRFARACPL